LHPFGNALGNALGNAVVKRVTDYQEERFRETEKLSQNMAEIDARNASGLAVDGLLGTLGRIDQDIADNIHDDFYGDLFVTTQENDQLAGIASEKNANAIFKYNAMSAQTQKDIAAIEQRSRQSAQKRAEQSAILRARQQEKFIDFRMDNPVYRGTAPLFDYDLALAADNAMWGAGKQRAQGVRDGIEAGVDLIERSANAYGRAFEKTFNRFSQIMNKTYDRFNQIMNKGFDSYIDQPADGVRTITDSYSLSGGYSTFTFGGELAFAFQSDGKVAVGWAGSPAGIKVDTGRVFEVGYTRLNWVPGIKTANAETILGGYGSTTSAAVDLKNYGSLGYVEAVSWDGKPFSSPKAATATGWSYGISIGPSVKNIVDSPVTVSTNVSYGEVVRGTKPIDLGWFGKLLYWGRQ